MPPRVLLVGEHGASADSRTALFPLPRHRAGGRLAAILGMQLAEYLRAFDRVNLCQGVPAFDRAAARSAAAGLRHPARVLLGARVAAAHGVAFRPFRSGAVHGPDCPARDDLGRAPAPCRPSCYGYLVLPHPSGRCRTWNDPRAAGRARRALRRFLQSARVA